MKIQSDILPPLNEMQSMINFIIKKGNKNLAESIMKNTLFSFTKVLKKKNPYNYISKSIKAITPLVNVITLKRKHKSFQMPEMLSTKKKLFLTNKWLLNTSRFNTKQSMDKTLSNELYLTVANKSLATKKRKELHTLAISLRKKTKKKFN